MGIGVFTPSGLCVGAAVVAKDFIEKVKSDLGTRVFAVSLILQPKPDFASSGASLKADQSYWLIRRHFIAELGEIGARIGVCCLYRHKNP